MTAIENFKNYLLPFAGRKELNFLQVGAFTGDASKWLLDNVLTHETSRLVDVDTWRGSDEIAHHEMDWSDVEEPPPAPITRPSGQGQRLRRSWGASSPYQSH